MMMMMIIIIIIINSESDEYLAIGYQRVSAAMPVQCSISWVIGPMWVGQ